MARCPIATRAPMVHGRPGSTCTIVPSCTLLSSPIVIASLSPRSTAVGHTLARAPSVTLPMTCAAACTNAAGWIVGEVMAGSTRSEGEAERDVRAHGARVRRFAIEHRRRDADAHRLLRIPLEHGGRHRQLR